MSGYVCPECGLDYDTIAPSDAKVAIRSFPRRYRSALAAAREEDGGEALVRRRPDPGTWSALEYTAHVADIFGAFTDILRRMRLEDHPTLTLFDPDERAASEHYADKDVDAVLADLEANATHLADELDNVSGDDWLRVATFPWGDRDLLMMARNAVHEGSHHLRDVEHVLDRARGAG